MYGFHSKPIENLYVPVAFSDVLHARVSPAAISIRLLGSVLLPDCWPSSNVTPTPVSTPLRTRDALNVPPLKAVVSSTYTFLMVPAVGITDATDATVPDVLPPNIGSEVETTLPLAPVTNPTLLSFDVTIAAIL